MYKAILVFIFIIFNINSSFCNTVNEEYAGLYQSGSVPNDSYANYSEKASSAATQNRKNAVLAVADTARASGGKAAVTVQSSGNTYYVRESNGSDKNPGSSSAPWKTIQHAADVAQPGDTVLVYPGQYDRVQIKRSGAPGKYITFKGINKPDLRHADLHCPPYNPRKPDHTPGNTQKNAVMKGFNIIGSASKILGYIRIENFEITEISANMSYDNTAIMIQYTRNIEIVNNFFHDLNPSKKDGGGALNAALTHHYPNDLYYNIDILFKGNVVWRVPGQHVNIKGKNWIVEDNELAQGIDSNTRTGAYIAGDNDAIRFQGSGHIIRNNYIHDFREKEMLGKPHIDAFQTFSNDPDLMWAYDILIENNIVANGFHQGLQASDLAEEKFRKNNVHHITMRNNIIMNLDGYFAAIFYHGYQDHFTFVNNVVYNASYIASLDHSPYGTIVNNIFMNGGAAFYGKNSPGTIWDYNIYYPDFDKSYKNSTYDKNSLFGVHPKISFPSNFKGPDGIWNTSDDPPRMTIASNSPIINAGINLSHLGFIVDSLGKPRPKGGKWTLGVVEWLLGNPDPDPLPTFTNTPTPKTPSKPGPTNTFTPTRTFTPTKTNTPTQKPASGKTPKPPSSEIRKNLLGYWSLEDGKGTVAQDLSGRNNHGTLKNGPSWNPSGADKGLSFDGNNDYVDLGNLNVSGDRITLSAWIKADRFNHLSMEDGRIISKARGVSESDHYWMLSTVVTNQGPKLRFRVKTRGSTSTLIADSGTLKTGVWTHVAAVYNGKHMILYKDGQEVGRMSKSGSIDQSSTAPVWIGANPTSASSRPFDGIIRSVVIYEQALDESDIAALANGVLPVDSPVPVPATNTPTNTPTFTKTPVPPKNTSTPTRTFTPTWTFTPTKTPVPTNTPDNSAGSSGDIQSSLVGFWLMDEGSGSTSKDSSGQGRHGVLRNGPKWVNGYSGKALSFDGSDDYLDLGNFDVKGNQLTLSAWIKADRFNHLTYEDVRIISKATDLMGYNHNWMLGTVWSNSGPLLRFRIKAGGAVATLDSGIHTLQPGVWTHIAAVYTGQHMILYKNGQEVGRMAKSGSIDQNPKAPVWIGSNPIYANSRPFDGIIDNVGIYSRALAQNEISNLANGSVPSSSGSNHAPVIPLPTHTPTSTPKAAPTATPTVTATPKPLPTATPVSNLTKGLTAYWALDEGKGLTASDQSGNKRGGILANGPTWVNGRSGKAVSFDGVNDYINVGNFDLSGNQLTITAWFNASRFNHLEYEDPRIIAKAFNQMDYDNFWMLGTIKTQEGTRLRFRLRTNGDASTLIASDGTLRTNTWIHVAAVYTGQHMVLYKDGQEVGRMSKTGNIDKDPQVPVWIGNNPVVANSKPFRGIIDEVRVYNRALSPHEITSLVNGSN
jgi:hypothetical protein